MFYLSHYFVLARDFNLNSFHRSVELNTSGSIL